MPDKTPSSNEDVVPDEASLDGALTDLEGMLDGQASTEDDGEPTESTEAGEQYTIPLLDDVIIPDVEVVDEFDDLDDVVSPIGRALPSLDDSGSQDVIKRLTNEVEVIVQTGMEEALNAAVPKITERVRKHVGIILPEILDQLVDLKTPKNRS